MAAAAQKATQATGRNTDGTFSSGKNVVAYWKKELDAAQKREKDWSDAAKKITELYETCKEQKNAFNILYSNTEVLAPALYNATPAPVVQRRFKDSDPLGKAVSEVCTRALTYFIDTPDSNYDPFDELMNDAVLAALVPGRGITWLKYDAEYEPIQVPARSAEIAKEGAQANEGDPQTEADLPIAPERVTYEAICGQNVPWDEFRIGYAKRWSGVPWVARHHAMNYTDLLRGFGKDVADKIKLVMPEGGGQNMAVSDTAGEDAEKVRTFGTCNVWEVWHKSTRKVVFICEEYPDGPCKIIDDPLELKSFFPCPKPLQFFAKVGGLVPVPLYEKYKNQAEELNRITLRINRIISALKVRGFYDAALRGLDTLLSGEDNTLLPAALSASLREGANPQNSIWLMPLQELQAVLSGLYIQREQLKSVIYEITGISDIIRGSTAASESATAQQLKSQWGTMRLRRMQNAVQKYVRDCLRIMSEILANKFSPQTLAAITNLPYPTAQTKAAAQARMQQLQQAAAQMAQSGQPPNPQDPQTQQLQQEGQQLTQVLGQPSWDEIKQLLTNNLLFKYRIDIETDSTIDPESSADQKNISDVMMAIAQIFQNAGPLVEQGVLPMAAVKGLLLTIVRRFRFGDQLEEYLNQIPDQMPPSQGQDDGKAAESAAKVKVIEAQAQLADKKAQNESALMDKEMEIKQAELQLKQQELALKQEELDQRRQLNQINHQGKMQAAQAKAAQAAAQAMMPSPQPAAGTA